MPIVATAATGLLNDKLRDLFGQFGNIANWGKRPTATPYPEDWESHGFAANYRTTARDFYGLEMPEEELRGVFERIHIPVARKWETAFGGRSNVKAGSKEAQIVQNVGPHATHIYFAKLRIAGRWVARPARADYASGDIPGTFRFPTEPGMGINEVGDKVPLDTVQKLAIKLKASNNAGVSPNPAGPGLVTREASALPAPGGSVWQKVAVGVAVALIAAMVVRQ